MVSCKEVSTKRLILKNTHALETFKNNSSYVTYDIDINQDGILDKVVSNAQNYGNQLLFFKKETNGTYQKVLESINFSEDGGRILEAITPVKTENTILKIATFFPNGGTNRAEYFVDYSASNVSWELSKIVYKVSDWQNNPNKIVNCTFETRVKMSKLQTSEGLAQLKHLPLPTERERVCDEYSVE